MKKILIVSDIHFGKSRESTTNQGITRQANSEAGKVLKSLTPRFKEINPDLLLHMGDALRDVDQKEIDLDSLTQITRLIADLELPTISLLGNHELWAFSREEVESIYQDLGQKSQFFGLRDLGEFQVLWLDFEVDDKLAFISQERLEWIENIDIKDKPLLIFSHYSMVSLDPAGSFYFENNPEEMSFKNAQEVVAALSSFPKKIFINAHTHFVSHKQLSGSHFISNPAFSENIAAEKYEDNNPGVYSILEVDKDKFVFSSYSGKFCFAKIEGNI